MEESSQLDSSWVNDGLKMIEFCKLCQVNSCKDRDIILLLLAILFVYNNYIARMERVVCLPSHPFPVKRVSKPLRVHKQFAWV